EEVGCGGGRRGWLGGAGGQSGEVICSRNFLPFGGAGAKGRAAGALAFSRVGAVLAANGSRRVRNHHQPAPEGSTMRRGPPPPNLPQPLRPRPRPDRDQRSSPVVWTCARAIDPVVCHLIGPAGAILPTPRALPSPFARLTHPAGHNKKPWRAGGVRFPPNKKPRRGAMKLQCLLGPE